MAREPAKDSKSKMFLQPAVCSRRSLVILGLTAVRNQDASVAGRRSFQGVRKMPSYRQRPARAGADPDTGPVLLSVLDRAGNRRERRGLNKEIHSRQRQQRVHTGRGMPASERGDQAQNALPATGACVLQRWTVTLPRSASRPGGVAPPARCLCPWPASARLRAPIRPGGDLRHA